MTHAGEQRIWTIVGRLERQLPRGGEIFAARQFDKAMASGDDDCASLWSSVSSRLHLLHEIAKPSGLGSRCVA